MTSSTPVGAEQNEPIPPAAALAPVQPFAGFAGPAAPQMGLRAAITADYRKPETALMPGLIAEARKSHQPQATGLARRLAVALRKQGASGGVDSLIHEFALSSQEGVALMCLAEALLRIPDKNTRDALIRDKISEGDWQAHAGGPSLFVNAAAWGLMITGKLVSTSSEHGLSSALTRLIGKGGEPLVRKAVDVAMRLMGEHFVAGETIDEALSRSRRYEARGFRYSYDMLGEAATTAEEAALYYSLYETALHAIGKAAAGRGIYEGPGLSIKLSALHPRYSRAQYVRVMSELLPRLRALAQLARQYDVGFNIDAEETERLDISLDLLDALCQDPALAGWNGIGFVVQAYQKRAASVVDHLIELGRRTRHRIMVRLVKGAYWDAEIKRAQIDGLDGYPVFTRKCHTDVSYLACASRLLAAPEAVYPQFATHNAHTLAAIYEMAGPDYFRGQYEFQCLHGMGEPLYEEVTPAVKDGGLNRPCRIYAPVGSHATLLAYLVRRLLENGANTSFVNQIADLDFPIEQLVADPLLAAEAISPVGAPHERIPLPRDLYRDQGVVGRNNSMGLDLSSEAELNELAAALTHSVSVAWHAGPSGVNRDTAKRRVAPIVNPADHRDIVGYVAETTLDEVDQALKRAVAAASSWRSTSVLERAACLRRAADGLENQILSLLGLIMREAGKSISAAISEVREAVDFLRYYAGQIDAHFANDTHVPIGPVACISPWNFPLAIFTGQVSAALAAGNPVLAKPAEQTPLTAAQAVRILHEAGVPDDVVQLLPGAGETVGRALTRDARTCAVMFTGSTQVAWAISRTLADRLDPDGNPVALIAETGGQNAMVVDSSALAEQVVLDVMQSAFDSAGQRCSAVRILCLQEEVAEPMLHMVRGAMHELQIGNPDQLATDVGPVIDADARAGVIQHIETMRQCGFPVEQLPLPAECEYGTFVPPTLIEIDSVADVEREVFGPVLHVLRYARENLDGLIDDINDTGYGLTFGVHTRVDETVEHLAERIRAGNLYVNRNTIGAVVGVQPFGGEGLSGTGPKAGGPLYLYRLLKSCPAQQLAEFSMPDDALAALDTYIAWLDEYGLPQALEHAINMRATSRVQGHTKLPGPTGESNTYRLKPRGPLLCWPATELGAQVQLAAALASGNRAAFVKSAPGAVHAARLSAVLPRELVHRYVSVDESVLDAAEALGGVLFEGPPEEALRLNQRLARRDGPIVQVQRVSPKMLVREQGYRIDRLLREVSLSINTAAAGGNAALMMLG